MSKISDFTFTSLLTLAALFLPVEAGAVISLPAETSAAVSSFPIETASCVLPPDTTQQDKGFQGVQYAKVTVSEKKVPLFSGYGIYTDLCGLGMAQFGKWGQYEAGAHFGIKGKYYPAVEIGIGQSDHKDGRSHLHYNIHSPYFRVGLDYNLNKNVTAKNRYFVGVRYGFSSFAYDLSGPDIKDNYFGGTFPIDYNSVNGNAHWGEILFGIQMQLWKFVHLGWTIRYRARLSEKEGLPGHAFYIPGYGKGGESSGTFGGTFNVVFEL